MAQISISAFKVRDACNAYLADREKRIEAKREEAVQELMNKVPLRWKFWQKKHTRESAIAELKSSHGITVCSEWSMIEITGSRMAEHVKEILSAAQIASINYDESRSIVTLKSEEVKLLEKYLI